jgi:hypothetical protein
MDDSNLATTISQLLGRDPLPPNRAATLLESWLAAMESIRALSIGGQAGVGESDDPIRQQR